MQITPQTRLKKLKKETVFMAKAFLFQLKRPSRKDINFPQNSFCSTRPMPSQRDSLNDEDTGTSVESFYTTQFAHHKNYRPSSAFDDRPGINLCRVLKKSPISRPHALGLRRGETDGKTGSNTTGL